MSISQEATELSNKLNAITRKEQRQVYLKRYNTRRGLFRICDKPLGFCTSQVAMTENTCDKDNQKELRLLCTSRLKYCLLDTQQKIRQKQASLKLFRLTYETRNTNLTE